MRYQVLAKKHKVFGKSFGEYFERDLPDAQERTLIGGGFIVRAPVKKKQPRPSQAVVLVKEPSAATDDAPTDAPNGESTEPPEGMSTSG